jgi:hypothetical protein
MVEKKDDIGRGLAVIVDPEVTVKDVVVLVDPVGKGEEKGWKGRNPQPGAHDGRSGLVGPRQDMLRADPRKDSIGKKTDPAVPAAHMVLFSDQRVGQFADGSDIVKGHEKMSVGDR